MSASVLPLAILSLLAATACERAIDPARWFPLDEGLTWRYRTELPQRKQTVDSVYRVLGRRTMSDVGLHGRREKEMAREGIAVEEHRSTYPTMWSGPNEVELSIWVTDGAWRNRVYMQYDGDALVPQAGFEDRHVLPVELRAGLAWESETVIVGQKAGEGYTHRHRLEREDEAIIVPAGTFRGCLRLETESVIRPEAPGKPEIVYLYREWYAPEVGLVRMESWGDRERRDVRSRTELLEHGRGLTVREKLRVAEPPPSRDPS